MKIVVLSSYTSSLFWFRMEMMADLKSAGHEVYAVGSEPEKEWEKKFENLGITYRQISVSRTGINPFEDIKTLRDIYRLFKIIAPDKIFVYQAKTIVYGSIAAKLCGITENYLLIAGLGSIFRGTGIKACVVKTVMKLQYKIAFKYAKLVFLQNNDDKQELISSGLLLEKNTVMINGSGVNLKKFYQEPLPEIPSFLYIGRLIRDKGIGEYLKACKIIKSKYPEVRCLLVGPFDTNPSALTQQELQPYIEDRTIEYFGEQTDVRPFIKQCQVYILPSYHEGTPKTVLESMAMGRAIITTDAPGCRETVKDGVNGYLVEVRNPEAIADKMEYLIHHPQIIIRMAEAGKKMAIEKYDVRKVNSRIMQAMELIKQ